MANKLTMTYVPTFVPKDLPHYEQDRLMAWYNQGKCEDFLRDTDKHIFDIIHRQIRGEEIPSDLLKSYLTVNDNAVSGYPTNDQDKVLGSAFWTDWEDIFLKKNQNNKETF